MDCTAPRVYIENIKKLGEGKEEPLLPTVESLKILGYPLLGYLPLNCHTSKKGFQSIQEMMSSNATSVKCLFPKNDGGTKNVEKYVELCRVQIKC